MSEIEILVNKLTNVGNTQVIRNSGLLPYPTDIDIYADIEDINSLVDIIKTNGMVVTFISSSKLQAKGYVGSEFYIIDILFNCNYITELFCDVAVTDEFMREVKQDTVVGRFLRYVYMLRSDTKYTKYVDAHYEELKDIIMGTRYIDKQVFRSLPSRRQVSLLMSHRLVSILKYVEFRHVICMFVYKVKNFVHGLGSGKVYAIVGPDGSGKTTIIEELSMFGNIKSIYMGDKDFLLQSVYDFFLNRGFKFLGLIFIPMYIEQWLRYVHASLLNLAGIDVVTDRYPGLSGVVTGGKAYKLLYSVFPPADRYVVLKVDTGVLLERSDELDAVEVDATYKVLIEVMPKQKVCIVNNSHLYKCVNEVGGIIFSDL